VAAGHGELAESEVDKLYKYVLGGVFYKRSIEYKRDWLKEKNPKAILGSIPKPELESKEDSN